MNLIQRVQKDAQGMDEENPGWWRNINLEKFLGKAVPLYEIPLPQIWNELENLWKEEIAQREFSAWKKGEIDFVDCSEEGKYKIATESWED